MALRRPGPLEGTFYVVIALAYVAYAVVTVGKAYQEHDIVGAAVLTLFMGFAGFILFLMVAMGLTDSWDGPGDF